MRNGAATMINDHLAPALACIVFFALGILIGCA